MTVRQYGDNPYRMFRACSDMVWPYLKHDVLSSPTTALQPGAGHPGKGYERGWIEGLSNARMNYATAPDTVSTVISGLHQHLSEGWRVDQILVNRMAPSGILRPHRDGGKPRVYRFHLPIVTNEKVMFWDEIHDRFLHLEEKYWHGPIPHIGVLHSMENYGAEERVHLIVDLEAPK